MGHLLVNRPDPLVKMASLTNRLICWPITPTCWPTGQSVGQAKFLGQWVTTVLCRTSSSFLFPHHKAFFTRGRQGGTRSKSHHLGSEMQKGHIIHTRQCLSKQRGKSDFQCKRISIYCRLKVRSCFRTGERAAFDPKDRRWLQTKPIRACS